MAGTQHHAKAQMYDSDSGIDCGLRDPFGNNIRIVQPAPGPLVPPDPAEFAQS